ncbi:MAG: DUF4870 domain-containing protein [Anaerolineales bacterium]
MAKSSTKKSTATADKKMVPAPLSASDERTWAMIAHFSILVNLASGILGPVVAFIIYAAYKDRSRYVAYQSLQSFVFQLVWWVGGGALVGVVWAITGVLSIVLIGLILIPFACIFTLLPVVALVYGVYGGIEASQGRDFKYWLIGDWVRGTLDE